jgi:hypothetical protein
MDYRLKKLYESILNQNAEQLNTNSINEAYKQVLEQTSSIRSASSAQQQILTPVSSAKTSSSVATTSAGWSISNYKNNSFNNIILKTLKVKSMPTHELYPLQTTDNLLLSEKDKKIFDTLYSATDGSKATGNGEIAVYWLFGGYQQINSNQGGVNGLGEKGADAPDIQIGPDPSQGLVEIKSYKNLNDISLGKFKDDKENRYLLSILLGSHVLTTAIKGSFGKKDRPVTVDVFSSREIIEAFMSFKTTRTLLEQLKANSSTSPLFNTVGILEQIFATTGHLMTELSISSKDQPEKMANSLLRKFAENKLLRKPGLKPGCGIINITKDSRHAIEIITTGGKTLNPKANYIESVSSSSGELKISNLKDLLS